MERKKFTCNYRMTEAYYKEILVGQSGSHQIRLIVLGVAAIAFAIFGYFNGHALSSTILWSLIGVFLIVGVLFSDAKRKSDTEISELKDSNLNFNYQVNIEVGESVKITEDQAKNEYRFRDAYGVRDTDNFVILYFGENRERRVPILKSALYGGSVKDLKEWIQRQIQVKA